MAIIEYSNVKQNVISQEKSSKVKYNYFRQKIKQCYYKGKNCPVHLN